MPGLRLAAGSAAWRSIRTEARRGAGEGVVEISIFEGRSTEAKHVLVRTLIARVSAQAGIAAQDLKIAIFETLRASWDIRGLPGDELELSYRVDM